MRELSGTEPRRRDGGARMVPDGPVRTPRPTTAWLT
jgi:hypothetical protein